MSSSSPPPTMKPAKPGGAPSTLTAALQSFGLAAKDPPPTDPQPEAVVGGRALVAMLLGRDPEGSGDHDLLTVDGVERSFTQTLALVLSGDEFHHNVLTRLIEGAPPPHLALGPGPDAERLAAIDVFAALEGLSALFLPFAACDNWIDFFLEVLAEDGPWRLALTSLSESEGEGAAAQLAQRIGLARWALTAPPGSGAVIDARVFRSSVVEARLLYFGAETKRLRVEARRGGSAVVPTELRQTDLGEPFSEEIAWRAASEIEWTDAAALDRRFGTARLEIPEAAHCESLALSLLDAVRSVGPTLRCRVSPAPKTMARLLDAVNERLRGEDRLNAAEAVEALAVAAPFAPEAATLAAEEAFWRAADPGLEEQEQHSSRRVANGSNSNGKSPLDADLSDAIDRAPRLSVEEATVETARVVAARAPAGVIAEWLSALGPVSRIEALMAIERDHAPAWIPVLSHLDPTLAERTAFSAALGAGRFALAQRRWRDVWLWGVRAESLAGRDPSRRLKTAHVLREAPIPMAMERAAAILAEFGDADPALFEIKIGLERKLAEADPLRPLFYLRRAERRLLRQAVTRSLDAAHQSSEDPTADTLAAQMAARCALASVLGAQRRPDAAKAILDDLVEQAETDLVARRAAQRLLAPMAAQAGEWEAALTAAESCLADEHDDQAALAKVRSLRALGRAADATPFLAARRGRLGPDLVVEEIRQHFFMADFDAALRIAEERLAYDPGAAGCRRLAVAAAIELGRAETALDHLDQLGAAIFGPVEALESVIQCYGAARLMGDARTATQSLNNAFALMGCQRIDWRRSAAGSSPTYHAVDDLVATGVYGGWLAKEIEALFSGAIFGPSPKREGPLVSVLCATRNSGARAIAAARSILDQSYRHLELILIDDASTDDALDRLRALRRSDPRAHVIANGERRGVAACWNIGLLAARGAYVAFQEADDWSHPDRLAKSIAALEAAPDLVGVATECIRVRPDGGLAIDPMGRSTQICESALVVRRRAALARAGFLDGVMGASDDAAAVGRLAAAEYIDRLQLLFGADAAPTLRWPLTFRRADASRRDGRSAETPHGTAHRDYQSAARAWRREIFAGQSSGWLAFPLRRRPFPAPDALSTAAPQDAAAKGGKRA